MSRKIFLSLSQATVDDLGPGQSRQVHSDRFLSKTVRGGKVSVRRAFSEFQCWRHIRPRETSRPSQSAKCPRLEIRTPGKRLGVCPDPKSGHPESTAEDAAVPMAVAATTFREETNCQHVLLSIGAGRVLQSYFQSESASQLLARVQPAVWEMRGRADGQGSHSLTRPHILPSWTSS